MGREANRMGHGSRGEPGRTYHEPSQRLPGDGQSYHGNHRAHHRPRRSGAEDPINSFVRMLAGVVHQKKLRSCGPTCLGEPKAVLIIGNSGHTTSSVKNSVAC